MKLVTRNYLWSEVTKYVNRCDMCQRFKNCTEVLAEKLIVTEVPKKLWMYLIVNFITKLSLVARKDLILVVYNQLSKMAHFVVTTKDTLAEGLVQLFKDNM